LTLLVLSRRFARLQGAGHSGELVGAKPSLASLSLAIDHRVRKSLHVPARLPHPRILDDRAIQPDHLNLLPFRSWRRITHHILPPRILDVLFQFDAQWPVVPEPVNAAVDFARLKDEATTLAQCDEFVHVHFDNPLSVPKDQTAS